MKYIVKVGESEYGPVDEEDVIRWVVEGRIQEDTPIRKEKVVRWMHASELDFLAEHFQRIQLETMEHNQEVSAGWFAKIVQGGKDPIRNVPKRGLTVGQTTAFVHRRLPSPASVALRLGAFLIDAGVAGVMALTLYTFGSGFIGAGLDPNTVFYILYCILSAAWLAYMGGTIGVFSQSIGMWFFGIMLKRSDDSASPVYLLRSYAFVLLMLFLGLAMAPIVFLNPKKGQALHDMLTDTSVILISARTSH